MMKSLVSERLLLEDLPNRERISMKLILLLLTRKKKLLLMVPTLSPNSRILRPLIPNFSRMLMSSRILMSMILMLITRESIRWRWIWKLDSREKRMLLLLIAETPKRRREKERLEKRLNTREPLSTKRQL